MKGSKGTFFQKVGHTLQHIARHRIHPVFLIFRRDIKTIKNNRAALAIIVLLCLLPSLYAWVNIYACWDPYANTGNLPVAIVNNDEGTVMNGEIINVGEKVMDELKENRSIGWQFVDEWQANYGLNEGQYYAMIEIPRNFSERLTSLATPTPQKPVVTYRVNEKLNAIAAKITNVAKDRLMESIESSFTKTVNEKAMEMIKTGTDNHQISRSVLQDLQSTLQEADGDIAAAKQHIDKAGENAANFQNYLLEAAALSPTLTDQINSLQQITAAGGSLAQKTDRTVQTIANNISSDLSRVQELNRQNQELIGRLKNINDTTLNENTKSLLQQNIVLCSSLHILIQADISSLSELNATYHLNALTLLVDSLRYADRLVAAQQTAMIQILDGQNSTAKEATAQALETLSQLSAELNQLAQNLSASYAAQGLPLLQGLGDKVAQSLDTTSGLVGSALAIVPQLDALSVFAAASSGLAAQQSAQMMNRLTDLQEDLDTILAEINSISSEDLDALDNIIQNHSSEIAEFVSSPLDVEQVEIYQGGTFGEGLTPFYTVLAIWVGVLLLCAFLTVHCNDLENHKLNLKQKHFGKMTLFLILSLIQSTIITLGDVFILGVKPADFGLMMFFSILCSISFVVIIFTLVSLFGNVGKAIVVIIMVFQIAGAGGIYPIQTNPRIFGLLHPLWPFTYGINGFREAIAGSNWASVRLNASALLGFILVFLPLAALKKPFHKIIEFLEKKYKEAGI
ncbi:MAG TPA: YhgE/Pip domain-containing protein [Desulfitobacterium dehalogenans]|uniref:YhgE/Pip domain-containing protein n=1 Tax=Desulfitobacterium dehalogenans TaxID=36854 RepID=A0A7C7DBB9_9FIRM|nr:YhgE/Pip domain-containing protein [Desulfitobacterium dehalogenans]